MNAKQTKERPILFSAPMVRAILDGSKTQTRRIADVAGIHVLCSPWQTGMRLWVQENHRLRCPIHETKSVECNYDADGEQQMEPLTSNEWEKMMARKNQVLADYGSIIPGRFMFRSLSRITLEITGIRVERLQDISERDAVEEGYQAMVIMEHPNAARIWYRWLWESINGPGSWLANPWVWVVEFKRITP